MDKLKMFREAVEREMTMALATSEGGRVTMRAVSPVNYGGAVLMFTSPASVKYRQLRANPRCCIAVGGFYAEATAELCGATMSDDNAALREAYLAKFPGAFAEGDDFGGRADEFVLLHPTRLTGWGFENDVPTPDGIPTVPFDISLV